MLNIEKLRQLRLAHPLTPFVLILKNGDRIRKP
jgi:hypothetical protein